MLKNKKLTKRQKSIKIGLNILNNLPRNNESSQYKKKLTTSMKNDTKHQTWINLSVIVWWNRDNSVIIKGNLINRDPVSWFGTLFTIFHIQMIAN